MCAAYAPTEQQRRRPAVSQSDTISPFVLMGEVLEKLKILGYETNFIRRQFDPIR